MPINEWEIVLYISMDYQWVGAYVSNSPHVLVVWVDLTGESKRYEQFSHEVFQSIQSHEARRFRVVLFPITYMSVVEGLYMYVCMYVYKPFRSDGFQVFWSNATVVELTVTV